MPLVPRLTLAFLLLFAGTSTASLRVGPAHAVTEATVAREFSGSGAAVAAGAGGFLAVSDVPWSGVTAMPLDASGNPLLDTAAALPLTSSRPALTWTGDFFIVGGAQYVDRAEGIYALRVTGTGLPLDAAPSLITATDYASAVTFTSNGTLLLVTWQTQSMHTQTLHGAVVDEQLALIGEPFTIATREVSSQAYWPRHSVASSGSEFLIAWKPSSADDALATFVIDSVGHVSARHQQLDGVVRHPVVAADAAGYVVAWHDGTTVSAARAGFDGTLIGAPARIYRGEAEIRELALGAAASTIAVAVTTTAQKQCHPHEQTTVTGVTLAPSLAPIRPPQVVSTSGMNSRVQIAVRDSAAVAAWDHWACDALTEAHASALAPLSAPFVISNTFRPSIQEDPAVATDGETALVVWSERRGDDSAPRIYATRVSAEGMPLQESFAITESGPAARAPRVTFDGVRYLVVWHQAAADLAVIAGTFVSPAGDVGAAFPIGTADGERKLDVTRAVHGLVVVWRTADTVAAARVLPSGEVRGAGSIEAKLPWTGVRAGSNGDETVVLYGSGELREPALHVAVLRSAYLRHTGTPDEVRCGMFKCTQGYVPFGVEWTGTRYVAVWAQIAHPAYWFKLRSMPLLAGGTPAATEPATIRVRDAIGPYADGAVTWNGSELTAFLRPSRYSPELRAVRLSASGLPLDDGSTVVSGTAGGPPDAVSIGSRSLVVYARMSRVYARTTAPPPRPARRRAVNFGS